MTALRAYLRQHHVGLLAILLVLGGGTAYAVNAPKNSVVSSSIKNGVVKSADLKNNGVKSVDVKDRTLTGADVRDGSLMGADLADRTVTTRDLDPKAVDEVQVYYYQNGDDNVVWEQDGVGKLTFSLTCGSDLSLDSFTAVEKSPARGGTYGIEHLNHGSEPAGTSPIVGAATVQRLGDVGQPVGGAGFGGSKFGFGQVVMFIQTPTLEVYADIEVTICTARAVVSINHRPEGSVISRPAGARGAQSCTASGAAYCTEPDA